MAWWHARLLFYGDDLLSVDLDRLVPEEIHGDQASNGSLHLTAVQVSGYSLYGQVRGYYALGVAELALDPQTGETAPIDPETDLDPARHLTPRQKQVVREWLKEQSQMAWDTSLSSFRQALE